MDSCAFDKLFSRNVPDILEKIFFSLDYESYKNCLKVSDTWNELLMSETFRKKGKAVFQDELKRDQDKLWQGANCGNESEVRKILSSGLLDVNSSHGFYHDAPLHSAAAGGHNSVVEVLLDGGADLNQENKKWRDSLTSCYIWQTHRRGSNST